MSRSLVWYAKLHHGAVEPMTPAIARAVAAGVKVATFELSIDAVEGVVSVDQDNLMAGRLILQQAIAGSGDTFKLGYIHVPGPEG